jgi:translation initiation factor IF-2
MGHIDHGKSTLLDYIRKSNIVAGEAGGITQHISAYEVERKGPKGVIERITFLDTPGHAAFQGMRARGARVADIAVLVVSAEDGVKTQTLEAYKAIKESAIPFIVAINKIDKPNANVDKTKQTLAEAEIFVEGWGGQIPWVGISAKTGQGVPELLDMLVLVTEMEALTYHPELPGEGVIIESNMDPKKGVSATVVLTDGSIKKGDYVVAEDSMAPVRIFENFLGKPIENASASSPVRITGWTTIPKVGSKVVTVNSKKDAEEIVLQAKKHPIAVSEVTHENGVRIIPLILKSDVVGTLEALEHEVLKLNHDRVKIKLVGKSVGTINESDVKNLIGSQHALIIGFHVGAEARAANLAEQQNIHIESFDIIYKLTEWLEQYISTQAPKREVVEELGRLRILRCFSQQKEKQVVGGRVETGKITLGSKAKILRRDVEIGEGEIVELQQQKLKSKEVLEGAECGLMFESKITIAERDILVPFVVVEK